jgi:3-hydroxybutyryl-CoA dehydrogenase
MTGPVSVGVLGAGAMGSGIAQVAASHGHPVILVDSDAPALDRARASLEKTMRRETEKGRLTEVSAGEILGRIRYQSDGLDAFAACGLVIEAIVERVLGVHFFNPAPVMPLVEIIPWLGTAPDVTRRTRALVDGWQKTTVLASDTPGFIVNRVARPFYGEALRIYDEGIADAATIDWAMRELGGFKMGPFELMDLIGLDVNFAVTSSVFQALFFDARFRPSITQQRLVEAGRLGRKTGRGFYEYGDGAARPEPTADRALGQTIVDRILVMLINEAVDAVHWRVASPADIDLAVTKGVNYPKGLLAWGAALGMDRVLAGLVALRDEYGEERYRPSVLLTRLVREGRTLV